MNRKRNVSFIKPDDPEFLKVMKRQVGYDDRNHKFDQLQNAEEDFVEDTDSEKPQVVVLSEGDLTAEEAESEQKRKEKEESEIKADLTQRVIFKPREKNKTVQSKTEDIKKKNSKNTQLLSFGESDDDSEDIDE